MGNKTLGWIFTHKGKLINYIAKKYDIDDLDCKSVININESSHTIHEHYHIGHIWFTYENEKRMLTFKYYIVRYNHSLPIRDRCLILSLGSWGKSIDIVKELIDEFTGFMDNNDGDDVKIDYNLGIKYDIVHRIRGWGSK